jgi:hypothetical protein
MDEARELKAQRRAPPLPSYAFHGEASVKRHGPWYTTGRVPRFQRLHDPDRPGQLLVQAGEPVAVVVWAHDFTDRAQTGWFLVMLDDDGEPDDERRWRLAVSDDVDRLVADGRLSRADWLARAETLELISATAAIEAGERCLARVLDGRT